MFWAPWACLGWRLLRPKITYTNRRYIPLLPHLSMIVVDTIVLTLVELPAAVISYIQNFIQKDLLHAMHFIYFWPDTEIVGPFPVQITLYSFIKLLKIIRFSAVVIDKVVKEDNMNLIKTIAIWMILLSRIILLKSSAENNIL